MRRAAALLFGCALGLSGCERAMHNMYEQPKYKPGSASSLFADGSSSRAPPAGSVPIHSEGEPQQPAVSLSLLQRGRERFDIYCAPCHGESGHGDGMVVERGFPAPPSFHTDVLRKAPDSHFYDVISHGYGVMYPYSDRIAPADRWAIVAYIRALQLSQNAPRNRLDARDLEELGGR